MLSNKWDEVFSDVEFTKSIIAMSPEEAQKALAEKGFDFSMDEINETGKELHTLICKCRSGELDAESLDEVAGGFGFKEGFIIGAVVLAGIICCGW